MPGEDIISCTWNWVNGIAGERMETETVWVRPASSDSSRQPYPCYSKDMSKVTSKLRLRARKAYGMTRIGCPGWMSTCGPRSTTGFKRSSPQASSMEAEAGAP